MSLEHRRAQRGPDHHETRPPAPTDRDRRTGRSRGRWLLVSVGLMALAVPTALFGLRLLGFNENHLPWVEAEPTRIVVSPYVEVEDRLTGGNDEPPFTVAADRPAYWRTAALDTYGDGIWKMSGTFADEPPGLDEDATTGGDRATIRQRFEINHLGAIWVPAAGEPTEVTIITGGPISFDRMNGTLAVDPDVSDSDGLRYTVVSGVPVPTPQQLRAAPPLDLDLIDPKVLAPVDTPVTVRALAHELTDGLPTNYDRVIAIQDHLRSFTFSLERKARPFDVDPIENLIEHREGTSPDFASAFALMARELDLPVRVATGFTTGNPVATDPDDPDLVIYEVQDRHAHAWPEVYFTGIGWVAFEPTPGRSIPGAEHYTGIASPGG